MCYTFYDGKGCVDLIGEKIKQLREAKNLSISELAEKANVAKSYLSSIERNIQSNPSIQFIEKISTVLGVPMNEMISEEPISNTQQLDSEWIQIVQEAIELGVPKETFKEYLEFNKWKKSKDK